jgi:ribosomal-protein-alanine N-acetyltransferase
VADILHIEEACFSAPWTRKMVEAELTGNPFAHFLLAKQIADEQSAPASVVAYLCYWIVFEEVRLMNLAVIESMRHRGIARTLVTAALQHGLSQSATRAVLEVRSSNTAAQTLYTGFGFRRVSVRAKYYSNPIEDAVLMELEPITLGPAPFSPTGHRSGGQTQPLQ